MNLKRTALVAALGALVAGASLGAASAQPFAPAHPRQAQVLDRAAHQRAVIRHEERTGRISPMKAHRLLIANKRLAMKEHRMARRNGGYITKRQQHRLDKQETHIARRARS